MSATPVPSDDGSTVLYGRDGAVAVLTLHRPQALNSINAQMRADLLASVQRAEADADVRAVVVRAAGRAFCAGADVTEFVPPASLTGVRAGKHAPSWVDALAGMRKPTIAAIHGYCFGGGLELALACDIRMACADAVFALPEVRLAVIPGAGGTQRLSRIVGIGHALRLILSGERIDTEYALRIGLVTDVVDRRAELDDAALRLAGVVAGGGPIALAYAKEAVRRGAELSLADGLELELDLSTLLQTTQDRVEGAAAFRERREPRYRGE